MAALVSTAINRARIAFPEMGTSVALSLLNDAHAEFLARYPLRRDMLLVPLVAGQQEYELDEAALQIEAAYYRSDTAQAQQLGVLQLHEQDSMHPGWRMDSAGTPGYYYLGGDSLAQVAIGLHPIPSDSTLLVTGASNATPIVISTQVAHGLSSGAPVEIDEVSGNLTANGKHYAQAVGPSTFALFSNSQLTLPVGGVGAYTGGGHVLASGSPILQLYIRRNYTLFEGGTLPSCLASIEPYVYSICRRWSEMTLPPDEWQKWQRLEYDAIHKMELHLSERAEQSAAVLKPQYMQSRRIF